MYRMHLIEIFPGIPLPYLWCGEKGMDKTKKKKKKKKSWIGVFSWFQALSDENTTRNLNRDDLKTIED